MSDPKEGAQILQCSDETIPLITRYRDVRGAARNWQLFSSNAPGRVPIPAEDLVRSIRQLPIEADPPLHHSIRTLLDPFFRRSNNDAYLTKIDTIVVEAISDLTTGLRVDIFQQLALPLQCKALAVLLNMPLVEAETWMEWGVKIFDQNHGAKTGTVVDAYNIEQIQRARHQSSGQEFYSYLIKLRLDGKALSDEELLGVSNLVFAGGRDTIINCISFIIAYFADHMRELKQVSQDPRLVNLAVEEFIRFVSPLSVIGRISTRDHNVGDHPVSKGERVGLCWAAANFDEDVFADSGKVNLGRCPNPHVGFGSGHHACMGAPHARALLRSFIRNLASCVSKIEIDKSIPKYETFASNNPCNGYEQLLVKIY